MDRREIGRPGLVDPELVAAFERDGFVVVPGLLDGRRARPLRRRGHGGGGPNATAADRTPARGEEPLPAVVRAVHEPVGGPPRGPPAHVPPRASAQAAAELLRVRAVRLWHDQALYKQPGGRATDAHQDHPYWPIKETASVTAWIPFEGSTLASGAMAYLPGSHAIGLRRFVNIFFGEPEDILADPRWPTSSRCSSRCRRARWRSTTGSPCTWPSRTRTDRARAVHTIIYFPDGSTRGYPHPHFAVDRGGIEVGEPIDGDVTPIVWPRPAGDLPAPPELPLKIDYIAANPGAAPPTTSSPR